jgi:hypothetical protein
MVADVNSWYLKIHKRIMWGKFHILSTTDWDYCRSYRSLRILLLYTHSVQVINRLNLKLRTPVSCIHNALLTLSLKQNKKASTFKGYITSIWDQEYWIPGEKVPKHWAMVWLTGMENIPNQAFFSNLYSSLVLTKRSIWLINKITHSMEHESFSRS